MRAGDLDARGRDAHNRNLECRGLRLRGLAAGSKGKHSLEPIVVRDVGPQLDQRMGIGVDPDGHRLTAPADVKVRTRGVNALETNTNDLILAHIAARVMTEAVLGRLADNYITLVVHLGERMSGMNVLGKAEATLTNVIVGACSALVPHTTDAGRAHVASGRV